MMAQSMTSILTVRGVERRADLERDRRHVVGRQRAFAGQQVLQVRALHVAHDEVEVPCLLTRRVDGDHVRVVDRGGDPRLALEALAEAGVAGAVGGDELEGDGPAERQLRRPVDDAHPPDGDDRLDRVHADARARGERHLRGRR